MKNSRNPCDTKSFYLQHEIRADGSHMHQSTFIVSATYCYRIFRVVFCSKPIREYFVNFVINRVLVKIISQAHQNKNNCVRSRKANILDEGIFWL